MITDLQVIGRLSTRARRDGDTLYLEVLDGTNVLASEVYINSGVTTPDEIPTLLDELLTSVITGGGYIVRVVGTADTGNTLTAKLGQGISVSGYQWYRDGVAISGSTAGSYIVQDIDAGKAITVTVSGVAYNGNATGIPQQVTSPRPGFAQASPLGAANGGRRVLSTGHNSVSMYLAKGDGDGVELTLSNVSIFANASNSEGVTPSDISVSGYVYFPGGTTYGPTQWVSRTLTGTVAAGATSASFTGAAAIESALYLVKFSNGEQRYCTLSSTANTLTWRAPLKSGAGTAISWKPRGATAWTRVPIVFANGGSSWVFTGGIAQYLKVNVLGTVTSELPAIVQLFVNSASGSGSYTLPAQQTPNGNDVQGFGIQEAFVDNSTDSSGTYWGGAPWLAAGFGNGSYRPISVKTINLRNNTKRPTMVFGDSIASSLSSWWQLWSGAVGIPSWVLSRSGEAPLGYLSQNGIRVNLYDKGSAVVQLGRNGYTLAALQALWAHLRANGFTRIIQVLPPPQTTSDTNDWSSEATQNQDTGTFAVNAQVLAVVGTVNGPDAVIDTTTPCKGATNVWKAGYTDDGTHPNAVGVAAIVAYLIAQGYAALFNL